MLSRFHLIPERYGQTADGHMDRIAISISRVSVLKRDKKSHDSLVGYGQEYGPISRYISHTIQDSSTVTVEGE